VQVHDSVWLRVCPSYCRPICRIILHWLPVRQRIQYNIAVMTYNCLHGTCIAYFADICVPVSTLPVHATLRSASRGDLVVPSTRARRYGPGSFRVSAPDSRTHGTVYLPILNTTTSVENSSCVVWRHGCSGNDQNGPRQDQKRPTATSKTAHR